MLLAVLLCVITRANARVLILYLLVSDRIHECHVSEEDVQDLQQNKRHTTIKIQ